MDIFHIIKGLNLVDAIKLNLTSCLFLFLPFTNFLLKKSYLKPSINNMYFILHYGGITFKIVFILSLW